MSTLEFEMKYLWPLRAEGYFVRIVKRLAEPDTYELECSMYITDRDEFSTTLLRYNPDTDPIIGPENECIGCRSKGERRSSKRGAEICPLCNDWTEPWTMKKHTQRGIFRINHDGRPVEFIEGVVVPEGMIEMKSEHVIWCVANALKDAHMFGSTMGGGGI